MSVGEIESLYPRLIRDAGRASRDRLRDGPRRRAVVRLYWGRWNPRLRDDQVTGEDPLRDYGPNAADHLRRTDGFPHCPDILVMCMYDAEANEVAPFEEFMGSHGGLGGWQSRPFALVPAGWSEPKPPIVGVRAMHDTIRGWLAETGLALRPHASA